MKLTIRRILNAIKNRWERYKLKRILHLFNNKKGIEIGGPTQFFSDGLPIYPVVDSLDGCNFKSQTIWEGAIQTGFTYNFGGRKNGFQYICEASELTEVPSNHYDFLLASHCLEHCANVLKTVREWQRVVKPGGIILLILPDKQYTFDHKRQVTTYRHLQDDFDKNIGEKDLTHLEEILSLHDLSRDIQAGDFENFKNRSLENFDNRCLHHHVFDFSLLTEIFVGLDIKILQKKWAPPYHQIIIGTKND
jgi:predicted SAM-dependent methyltransferase